MSDGVLHDALFNGLRPELKANFLLLNPQTRHELIQVAKRPKKANHISSQSKSGLLEICVVYLLNASIKEHLGPIVNSMAKESITSLVAEQFH